MLRIEERLVALAKSNRRLRLTLVALGLVGATFAGLGVARPAAVPEVIRAEASDRVYAAWIPPGSYRSIVLCSSGDQRRWTVSLVVGTKSYPVVVPPASNEIIEFPDGWMVRAGDDARLVSRLVPFDDAAKYNKVGERPEYVLSAWGVTASGPVEFAYRENK